MTTPVEPEKPVVVHNSRIVLVCIVLFAIIAVLLAICMVLEVVYLLFLQHGQIFFRVLAGLQWGLGGVAIASIGVASWRLARAAGFHQVRLENDGVHFRLGTKRKPCEAFFAWDQIAAVSFQSGPNNQYVFVSGKDGSQVNYSAYDIFGYKKLARQISARTGVPLTTLKTVKPSNAEKPAAPKN
jgi:hypothetical protein